MREDSQFQNQASSHRACDGVQIQRRQWRRPSELRGASDLWLADYGNGSFQQLRHLEVRQSGGSERDSQDRLHGLRLLCGFGDCRQHTRDSEADGRKRDELDANGACQWRLRCIRSSSRSGPTTVSGALPATGLPAEGGVISVKLGPGDTVTAPGFGNTNPQCPDCSILGTVTVIKTATPNKLYTWGITKNVDKTQVNTTPGNGAP